MAALLDRALAFVRTNELSRQMRRIERMVDGLDLVQRQKLARTYSKELKTAGECPEPRFYQSENGCLDRPWGDGTTVAWGRIRSDNRELQLRGMALWLAVAFYETQLAEDASGQSIHRRIIRVSRTLREALEQKPPRKQRASGRIDLDRVAASL